MEAFAEAVRNRELLRLAETDGTLAGDFLDLSQRRLKAGAATQIERTATFSQLATSIPILHTTVGS